MKKHADELAKHASIAQEHAARITAAMIARDQELNLKL